MNRTLSDPETLRREPELNHEDAGSSNSSNPAALRPGAFIALRYRNFRLFFVGQMISVAGTWMQIVAQQWLIYSLTHSAEWLGILSGASALPYVALSLHGGHLADRCSRRVIMVVTQTAMMILAFVLAFLASHWSPMHIQPWHIAVLSVLGGFVNAYAMPAQQAFVTDMVEDRRALGSAIALGSLQFNLARVLGPVLAGIALAKFGAAICFFINGVSFIAVIISLLMMRTRPVVAVANKGSIWDGFGYIVRNSAVMRVFMLVSSASFCVWSVGTLYPVYADEFVHVVYGIVMSPALRKADSAILLSQLMAATGAGAATGGLIAAAAANRLDRRISLYGAAFGFAGGLLLFALVHNYALALALLFVSSVGMVVFAVTANTTVQERAPDILRGRIMAVYALLFGGLMPAGGLEIGFIANRYGALQAVKINILMFTIIGMVTIVWHVIDNKASS